MTASDRSEPESVQSFSTPEEHALVYAAVIRSALDAVIVADEAGLVLAMNPAAEVMFGYSQTEAVGRPISALIVPDNLKQAHETGMSRYLATGEPHVLGQRVALEARCKDGRIIPVELAITEVSVPDRRLFTANLRDLSAVKASAAEIERQRDALHQSEKLAAFGSLLAGVAHELNNPLSIVLGQASILQEESQVAEYDTAVSTRIQKIEAAAQRCARVIRSFLAIARQRKAAKKPVDIAPLLDDTVQVVLYGLRSSGIAVLRDYQEPLPQVYTDPDQVQQIIVNLLVNASHALDEVEGHREIRLSAQSGPDDHVTVIVADNGPGVSDDAAKRIFDPFFTTKPQGIGTGIGLSVSRGLAEAQGGELRLLNAGQHGASFALSLPVVPLAHQDVANGDGSPMPNKGPLAELHALVIDDEEDVALLIAECLNRSGYTCDIAPNGRVGQALISEKAGSYNAVICDLRMPDLDGQGLYHWMQTNHPALVDRVLFVTGDALGPRAARFLADLGKPVLEKPFTPADLIRLIAKFPPLP